MLQRMAVTNRLCIHPPHGVTPFERLEELNNHDCGLRLIAGLNNSIFTEQLIESTYMGLGHEPGRATCLVVKCPDDEHLGTELHRLWRGKFQPQHNVRECARDSQMPKRGVGEEHFRHAATWKTTEHIATCKVAHGDVNAHHALEFGQTMVKWFMKIWHSSFYDTKVVKNLKKKVSKDCNDVDMTIIKTIIDEIVTPFTYICNQSFLSGIVPNKMKFAKVIPLHKNGNHNVFTNYRPVSLLPQFSKIL